MERSRALSGFRNVFFTSMDRQTGINFALRKKLYLPRAGLPNGNPSERKTLLGDLNTARKKRLIFRHGQKSLR